MNTKRNSIPMIVYCIILLFLITNIHHILALLNIPKCMTSGAKYYWKIEAICKGRSTFMDMNPLTKIEGSYFLEFRRCDTNKGGIEVEYYRLYLWVREGEYYYPWWGGREQISYYWSDKIDIEEEQTITIENGLSKIFVIHLQIYVYSIIYLNVCCPLFLSNDLRPNETTTYWYKVTPREAMVFKYKNQQKYHEHTYTNYTTLTFDKDLGILLEYKAAIDYSWGYYYSSGGRV